MVRYNGIIMTEIRYMELMKEAQKKKSIQARLNLYFFGVEEICLSDWLWFYGFSIFCVIVTIVNLIVANLPV